MAGFDHILLTGDYNYPNINWENNSTSTGLDQKEFNFLESSKDCFLTQLIKEPTRGRGSDKPTVLDLVFTDNENLIMSTEVTAALGKSDHSIVEVTMDCQPYREQVNKTMYLYNKGDYDKMKDILASYNWEEDFKDKEVEDQWALLTERYNRAVNDCIPKRTLSSKTQRHSIPADAETRELIKLKNKLWKKYLKDNNPDTHKEYCRIRNKVRKKTRQAKKRYESSIVNSIKTNPKAFWRYAQQTNKTKVGIPTLDRGDDSHNKAETDEEKAETLASFFSKVFTKEPEDDLPQENPFTTNETSSCDITPSKVEKLLNKLKPSKSPGPDGLHPRVLKELSSTLCNPLCLLFNTSLNSGTLPAEWKKATITAIFKKGDKTQPCNYRPVSLTSIICKIMESLVRDEICTFMKKKTL